MNYNRLDILNHHLKKVRLILDDIIMDDCVIYVSMSGGSIFVTILQNYKVGIPITEAYGYHYGYEIPLSLLMQVQKIINLELL